MKTQMGFVSAFLAVAAPAVLMADATLPTTFDASTGYVTMTGTDSAHGSRSQYAFCNSDNDGSLPPVGTGKTGKWSDGLAPHSGTNYYVGSGMTLCTDNASGACTFAGDRLVIGSDGVLQSMANVSNSARINDLWMIGGSKFSWSAVKNPLTGTAHVVDSSKRFVYFTVSYSGNAIQTFKMKLVGDENQQVFASGTNAKDASEVDGVVRSGHLDLDCDLSEYTGKVLLSDKMLVRIGTSLPGTAQMWSGKYNGYFGSMPNKGNLSVGEVILVRNTKLVASQGTTLTVKKLQWADSTSSLGVAWGAATDGPGKLVIETRTGNWPSIPIAVTVDGMPYTYDGEIIRIKAAALPAGGLTASDFVFPEVLGVSFSVAQEEATGDCVISMHGAEWVKHTANKTDASHKNPNDFTSCTNHSGKYFWANNSCPAEDAQATEKIWSFSGVNMYPMDAQYYQQFGAVSDGIYTIPSKYVYFDNVGGGGGIEHFSTCSGLRADFIWNGFYDNGNAGASAVKVTTPDRTGTLNTFGYYGTIRLMDGSSNTLLMYGSGLELIAAVLSGGGDLTLKTFPNASASATNQGWHELTADNSEWTGKLNITQVYELKKYLPVVTPNMDICCRVVISDAKNLGGARAAYAYDALHIEHYAKLVIREDVTLANGLNRGVSIGDIGRLWQPAGKTLTINQPITLWGNLSKEGPGTLVLGGSSLKFNGATQADAPTANSNLVTVAEGALKVTNAAALDGAAITFKSGTSLIVNPAATAATALRCVKSGSSLTAEGGSLTVAFGEATATICEPVICTATRVDLAFTVVRPNGYKVTVLDPTESDGVYTYKARLERTGLVLVVH